MSVNHRGRLLAVMIVTLALFTAVGARLVYLHCFLNEAILSRLLELQQVLVPIPSPRGTIYDRNMHEIATTVTTQSLYAVPSSIESPGNVAGRLAPILDIRRSLLARRLSAKKSFIWLARQLDAAVAARVRDLDIEGLHFISEPRRYYPKSTLVPDLVGITGIDGEGLEGIERLYEKTLRGEEGHMAMPRDAKGRPLIPLLDERKEPTGGSNVVLSIDEDLQHVAQEALRRACEQYTPQRGMAVIQDPRTGEVLAVVNWPDFDPNDFSRSSAVVRRNAAFVDLFEPGSVFKIVTTVAALEQQVVEPYEEIDCHNGRLLYRGRVIRDVHPLDKATFVDVIVHLSNIGTIEVAGRLGPERFDEYMRRMGFGQRTGTGFPGEPRGILRPVDKWSKRSMGALPIGQEIAVTALQLAQAFSAVANSGVKMQPRIVRAILANDGSVVEEFEPETVRTVCSPQVARLTTEILCGVVDNGTGTQAAVEGYRIAGKTGTAQIAVPGGYAKDRNMTVFAGFVPANAPAFTIVVVLDSPQTGKLPDTGGYVAAPVFNEIAQHSLRIAGIAPQVPETESPALTEIAEIAANNEDVVPSLRPHEAAPRRSALAGRTRVRMPLSLVYEAEYADSMLPESTFEEPVIAREKRVAVSDRPSG